MTHLDDETLALLAFGEPTENRADVHAHLDGCAECRTSLERLRATVTVGRSLRPEDLHLPSPPERVWDGIAAQLGVAPETDRTADAEVLDLPTHAERRARSRVGWRVWAVAAAAAAILAVVVIGSVELTRRDSGSGTTVQNVALASVGSGSARGDAQLVRQGGGLALRVETTGLSTTSDAYYELWLMNPDTNSFISFGPVVPGTSTTRLLPKGLSVKSNPLIDISLQPFDGNPAHSSVSVLRGRFA